MSEKRKILRWRREQRARGLRGIGQGELGYELWYGGKEVGRTAVVYEGWGRKKLGYYWYAFDRNTASHPVATIEEAKKQCEEYVREKLGLVKKRGKGAGK